MNKEQGGGSERTPLVVVNPREEVIDGFSEPVFDAALSYEGDVYRMDNLDSIGDLPEFYDLQEALTDDPICNDIDDGGLWYDEFFVFDEEGLDEIDSETMLDDASSFYFVGGPLEDVGLVKNSIDEKSNRPVSHILDRNLVLDYGGFKQEQGYVTSSLMSLEQVIKNTPETLQDRLQNAGLNSENVDF